MKSLFKNTILTCLFTITAALLLSSCMPEPTPPPSVLDLRLHVEGIDSVVTAGTDTLDVEQVRLIHGISFFTLGPDSTIDLKPYANQISFSTGLSTNRLYGGGLPKYVYHAFTFKIIRAKNGEYASLSNPDAIFTEGGNYSIIVDGFFNGNEFTFKVPKAYSPVFEFTPPIAVGEEAVTYGFSISTDMKNWFNSANGDSLLNPAVDENKTAIYNNISGSFTIEQFSPES